MIFVIDNKMAKKKNNQDLDDFFFLHNLYIHPEIVNKENS